MLENAKQRFGAGNTIELDQPPPPDRHGAAGNIRMQ